MRKIVQEENCNIKLFLSDRHKGVRYLLRTQYPDIEHAFDGWHIPKSLMKMMKALDKNHPEVKAWKASINNHLWEQHKHVMETVLC